jgi:hypothetical protein
VLYKKKRPKINVSDIFLKRKNKLDIYSNKIRSEMKMINNFKSKFGDSSNNGCLESETYIIWSGAHYK